jgi:hypothetical protein
MRLGRRLPLLAFALGIALAAPDASRAAAPPDSAQLTELRERLKLETLVRVRGPGGPTKLSQPIAEAWGVRRATPGQVTRTAVFETADAKRPPAPPDSISWSRIEGIEIGHRRPGEGILVGALIGGLLVPAILTHVFCVDCEGGWNQGEAIVVGAGLGAASGAFLGYNSVKWVPVYPASQKPAP